MTAKSGWKKSLGTSKLEQGIATHKTPRRHSCGCWYIERKLWQMCDPHQQGLAAIVGQLQDLARAKMQGATPEQAASAAEALKESILKQSGEMTNPLSPIQDDNNH